MNIGAAIFDMDGLLVDTQPLWWESRVRMWTARGADPHDPFNVMGMRLDEGMAILRDHHGWTEPVEDLVRERVAIVKDLMRGPLELMSGADALLRHFERSAVPRALASSSPHELIDAILDRFDLRKRFNAVVSGYDVPSGKPAPDIFLEAARRLGVPPGECVVFEDAKSGLEAAKAAGMFAVMVPGKHHPEDGGFADLTLSRLDEFPNHHHVAAA